MGNAKLQYVQGRPIFTNINEHKNQYPYLTKNIDTDVCIIGGGITGAITSYYFSKENISCVLLEKRRIAHLSTSVTTSLLQYELDDNLSELTEYTTIENALKSYNLGLKALNEIEDFIYLQMHPTGKSRDCIKNIPNYKECLVF